MNRRELIGAAAVMLASAALPRTILAEDESATTVHVITTAHRKLDGKTPSPDLVEPVLAHLRMATRIQSEIRDPLSGKAMAAAVSEAAGFAAWLHWDTHNLGSARRHYRLAVEHAQRSSDPLLATYMPTESHPEYDDLLDQALTVQRLEFTESTSEAHMAASTLMISMINELVAVWDQQPARGHGGTADVVAHAREHGRPVRLIWPPGASRD